MLPFPILLDITHATVHSVILMATKTLMTKPLYTYFFSVIE
jgi:hypothetical protein